jgi:dTDP-glucose 4,6-dehydratase
MILISDASALICTNFLHDRFEGRDEPVAHLDELTYAGNLAHLTSLAGDERHIFVRGELGDKEWFAKQYEGATA